MLRGVLPIWPEKRGNVSPLWDWSICSLWEPNLANQHTQCYMTADAARLEWETTWLSDWAGADLLNVQWQTHPFIYVHVLYRHIHIQTHIYSSAYVDMATFLSLSLSPQTHQYINTFFPSPSSWWQYMKSRILTTEGTVPVPAPQVHTALNSSPVMWVRHRPSSLTRRTVRSKSPRPLCDPVSPVKLLFHQH